MRAKKVSSSDEYKRLHPDTISQLFTSVFPSLSNMAIFNLAYFCVGLQNEADEQFREVLNQELFRRRVLRVPHFSTENVNVGKFSNDEMDSIDTWFACDPVEPTAEDYYVKLFTNRDRWAERNPPKRKRRATKKSAEDRTKSCPGGHSDLGR